MLSPITESQYADALKRISELERELDTERAKREEAEQLARYRLEWCETVLAEDKEVRAAADLLRAEVAGLRREIDEALQITQISDLRCMANECGRARMNEYALEGHIKALLGEIETRFADEHLSKESLSIVREARAALATAPREG